MTEQARVLSFWFPEGLDRDLETHREFWVHRMRGGADERIALEFSELTERAAAGQLDSWAQNPEGRLALVVVLDQFSRSVWRESPRAFSQDPKALALTLGALDGGHYDALPNVWMKNFMLLPLTHCEGDDHLARIDRGIALADQLLKLAPAHLRPVYEFCAAQPREHRKVIAAFGRHPHRNSVLGRTSTPYEAAYLQKGAFPHQREIKW